MMEQALILLAMVAGVTQAFFPAAETKCNATHNASLCTVTVGGSVYIQVMTNATGHQLLWQKQLQSGPVNVCSLKKGKVKVQEPFRNSTQFFIHNGTLKITNAERNDSGLYHVEAFAPDGVLVKTINITLDVQENSLSIWILICFAVAALLIVVVIITCVCCGVRICKSSSGK